jgi:hypothetical protein
MVNYFTRFQQGGTPSILPQRPGRTGGVPYQVHIGGFIFGAVLGRLFVDPNCNAQVAETAAKNRFP